MFLAFIGSLSKEYMFKTRRIIDLIEGLLHPAPLVK